MRRLMAVMIVVVLWPSGTSNLLPGIPTLSADTVLVRAVRHASDVAGIDGLVPDETLVVERPANARDGASATLFVVEPEGAHVQRTPVTYGRGSRTWIQVASGVSVGDRVIVSDMRAWEGFDRVQLRRRMRLR